MASIPNKGGGNASKVLIEIWDWATSLVFGVAKFWIDFWSFWTWGTQLIIHIFAGIVLFVGLDSQVIINIIDLLMVASGMYALGLASVYSMDSGDEYKSYWNIILWLVILANSVMIFQYSELSWVSGLYLVVGGVGVFLIAGIIWDEDVYQNRFVQIIMILFLSILYGGGYFVTGLNQSWIYIPIFDQKIAWLISLSIPVFTDFFVKFGAYIEDSRYQESQDLIAKQARVSEEADILRRLRGVDDTRVPTFFDSTQRVSPVGEAKAEVDVQVDEESNEDVSQDVPEQFEPADEEVTSGKDIQGDSANEETVDESHSEADEEFADAADEEVSASVVQDEEPELVQNVPVENVESMENTEESITISDDDNDDDSKTDFNILMAAREVFLSTTMGAAPEISHILTETEASQLMEELSHFVPLRFDFPDVQAGECVRELNFWTDDLINAFNSLMPVKFEEYIRQTVAIQVVKLALDHVNNPQLRVAVGYQTPTEVANRIVEALSGRVIQFKETSQNLPLIITLTQIQEALEFVTGVDWSGLIAEEQEQRHSEKAAQLKAAAEEKAKNDALSRIKNALSGQRISRTVGLQSTLEESHLITLAQGIVSGEIDDSLIEDVSTFSGQDLSVYIQKVEQEIAAQREKDDALQTILEFMNRTEPGAKSGTTFNFGPELTEANKFIIAQFVFEVKSSTKGYKFFREAAELLIPDLNELVDAARKKQDEMLENARAKQTAVKTQDDSKPETLEIDSIEDFIDFISRESWSEAEQKLFDEMVNVWQQVKFFGTWQESKDGKEKWKVPPFIIRVLNSGDHTKVKAKLQESVGQFEDNLKSAFYVFSNSQSCIDRSRNAMEKRKSDKGPVSKGKKSKNKKPKQ